MNSKYKYLFQNVGVLTLSNFASKILVFLLVPLYTSVLTTEEYGMYDLAVSTVFLIYPVLTVNITDAVMRFTMDQSYSKKVIVSIGIRYVLAGVSIGGIILAAVGRCSAIPAIQGLEIYIFLYFLTYVINQFFIQLAKGLELVYHMGIAGILGTLVMLSANIVLLLVFRLGLPGFFIANILSQAVPAIYLFFRVRFWGFLTRDASDRTARKEMLTYSLPLICTTLGWWINNVSDKYVVAFICGIGANGILSVSYKIPAIMNTLQGIFIQAWQISAIKAYGDRDSSDFYGNFFMVLNLAMSAACSVLMLMSRPLAHLLYADDFFVAWRYVPFLLVSGVLNSASGFIGPILSAKKDSRSMARSAFYGAIANLVLNIVLVYLIGIQGATIATVIASYIIYTVRNHAVRNDLQTVSCEAVRLTWILLCAQAMIEVYTPYWGMEIVLMAIMVWINWATIHKFLRAARKVIHGGKNENHSDYAN